MTIARTMTDDELVDQFAAVSGDHPWYRDLGRAFEERAALRAAGHPSATLEDVLASLDERRRSDNEHVAIDRASLELERIRTQVAGWRAAAAEDAEDRAVLAGLNAEELIARYDRAFAARAEALCSGMFGSSDGLPQIQREAADLRFDRVKSELLTRLGNRAAGRAAA